MLHVGQDKLLEIIVEYCCSFHTFPYCFTELCYFLVFFIGEFPEGILCILPNVTTSKQRRLLQDIVKHGHSTCTRGHTGECSSLKVNRNSVHWLDMQGIFLGVCNFIIGTTLFCIRIMKCLFKILQVHWCSSCSTKSSVFFFSASHKGHVIAGFFLEQAN